MNGLLDIPTIDALYAASQAGVEIDLIVRGMCALRPGVPGLSEHIHVRSVIGRFLEHSRIFFFANGGPEDGPQSEVFCGSADWMTRNLYERCEVVFPVVDPALKRRLRDEILESYLRDNLKARLMDADGSYIAHQIRSRPQRPAIPYGASRSPDKLLTRVKTAAVESTPAEEAESVLSRNNPASRRGSHYIVSAPNC